MFTYKLIYYFLYVRIPLKAVPQESICQPTISGVFLYSKKLVIVTMKQAKLSIPNIHRTISDCDCHVLIRITNHVAEPKPSAKELQ